MPVENIVFSNQQKYYDAISASTKAGESGPFIRFMLREILDALSLQQENKFPETFESNDVNLNFDKILGKEFGIKFGIKFGIIEKQVLLLLVSNPTLTIKEIATKTNLSQRGAEKMFQKFTELGVISRQGSRKNGFWLVHK